MENGMAAHCSTPFGNQSLTPPLSLEWQRRSFQWEVLLHSTLSLLNLNKEAVGDVLWTEVNSYSK